MRDNVVVFGVLVIVVVIAILVVAPFVTIWSLNTLFGLGIAYGFYEWLAMVWLSTVTFGGIAFRRMGKD